MRVAHRGHDAHSFLLHSAFFWLLSLLASSLLWFAVVPLREKLAFGLFFSVVLQEIFRLLIYALLRKADKVNLSLASKLTVTNAHFVQVLRKLTENEHTRIFANRHILSYVVGLGFGIMSGAFSMVNVLADSLGPGTLGFNGEPPGFLMASAGLCLAMILCHTCWGVITFAGMNDRKYWMVAAVWGAHSLVSGLVSSLVKDSPATIMSTMSVSNPVFPPDLPGVSLLTSSGPLGISLYRRSISCRLC